jgi:uncharacterized membrane protein (Fun14 family)
MQQELVTPLASFAGSAAAGFFIGWTLRKILKILLLVVGLGLGVFFLALQFMANKGYLGKAEIDWNRIGTDAMGWLNGLVEQFSNQHIFAALGIPATSGLAVGIIAGLAKG